MYASILDSVRALAKKLGADPNGEDIETVLNNIAEAKGGKRTHKKSIAAAIDNITEVSESAPKSENNAKFAATPALFRVQDNLVSVNVPDGVTSIGDNAFYSCRALTNVTIPSSVTSIGVNAFNNCTALETITIDKPEGSIAGAPWGAPSTTQIIWNG